MATVTYGTRPTICRRAGGMPCARPRSCEHRRDPRAPRIHSRCRPLFHRKGATCDCRAELGCSNIGTCAFRAFVACHARSRTDKWRPVVPVHTGRPRGDLWTLLLGAPAADAELRRLRRVTSSNAHADIPCSSCYRARRATRTERRWIRRGARHPDRGTTDGADARRHACVRRTRPRRRAPGRHESGRI
jgi:hypothetical protein